MWPAITVTIKTFIMRRTENLLVRIRPSLFATFILERNLFGWQLGFGFLSFISIPVIFKTRHCFFKKSDRWFFLHVSEVATFVVFAIFCFEVTVFLRLTTLTKIYCWPGYWPVGLTFDFIAGCGSAGHVTSMLLVEICNQSGLDSLVESYFSAQVCFIVSTSGIKHDQLHSHHV